MSGKVFLEYDQVQLDREMNLRGRWPEHQSYFDRWAADSLHVRKTYNCHSDLAYGDTPGQKLDLFLPGGEERAQRPGKTPLLAFIHGGYWKSLDKGDFSYLAPAYLERGIAFASLNYDLSPKADIGEMVAQVHRGLAWLVRRAGEYDLDPSGLYVAGHSAGGHLAAMAVNPAWTAAYDLSPEVIKGGCSVSGVYDLAPVALSFQQEELQIAPRVVESFSPLTNVPAAAAPLICAVGSDETAEFIRQQGVYVEAWRQKGLSCQVIDLPGDNHFSAADRLGERDHPLYLALLELTSS
ncbi:alpha/beta hydrolase [Denitrobaculum tricleocarpae]|nr:alpha/beta hydrolase [Denitrobaculum tricleocarpae]